MGWVEPAIAGAGLLMNVLGSGGGGGGRGRSSKAIRQAIAELRASRPTGYITDDDLRSAELTRGRIAAGVNANATGTTAAARGRFRQRGLAGSPSEERTLARINDQTAGGIEKANEYGEEQLYNTRRSREMVQHQQDTAIFGAQVGDAQREADRQQAEQGAFWNSLNEYIPTIVGALGPSGPGATAGPTVDSPIPGPPRAQPGGFDPATPRNLG